MDLLINKLPPNYKPTHTVPDSKMYEILGEKGIREMVSQHYNLLIDSEIKYMFPPWGYGLEQAKERSADFFVQKLGGPDYFNQNRGEPKLSQRHSYFKITPEARIIWLECYRVVLLDLEMSESIIIKFWDYLHDFSNWMVNTNSPQQELFSISKE